MDNSQDIQREEIHHRSIELRFYRRSDGLHEVEGRLIDRKAHPFRRMLSGDVMPAGTPLHDISVRLVVDETMMVHDVGVTMAATPYGLCREAERTLEPLKGVRIGSGWNAKVREMLGGAASCTHVRELLGPMATTVYQGLAPQRIAELQQPGNEAKRRARVDSCYAYSGEREVVARLWPELYRGTPARGDGNE